MTGPPTDYTILKAKEALADRMRSLRRDRNLSQRQAAERGGLDQSNWAKMERAAGPTPQLDTLLKIQYALELESLDALFGSHPTRELLHITES